MESDLVLGGSVAGNLMNEQVASELVTLVDFAHTCRGLTTPVPVIVDDEGIKASDAILIENGVLRSYMHNRLNALKMGHSPQGNARADIFSDEPLIRMRNTAILPGKSQLEDLIASVDKGYYLVRSSNGQADTTSEFMFGIAEGYEITNGRIGQAIRDTTISGVAFDMLKTVDMISSDMTWGSSGWCGKKQTITVGMGGPALRCRI
ncbi:MAG: TldD/PmbA family protein, partial [Symbiobacteriaceae bacterium]|nr:TldD/PmbA family protein [Symbiobacteriaceae bacterium]